MTETQEAALLRRIAIEWRRVQEDGRPWGVWVRRYAPVPPDFDGSRFRELPERAWFLTEEGMTVQSPWAYRRFEVVQGGRLWCLRFWPEPNPLFSTQLHHIGSAAFAPYRDLKGVYLEWQWGGLWGRGWRCTFSPAGTVIFSQELWVS
jgi:hypothetical protein